VIITIHYEDDDDGDDDDDNNNNNFKQILLQLSCRMALKLIDPL
jgi:hypothetical protein